MKSILIVILTLLLALAALLTRPGKREFALYLLDRQSPDGAWAGGDLSQAESVLKGVKFNDHWLWTDVEQDDKVVYTGLFSHFVPHSFSDKSLANVDQLAKLVGKVEEARK